MGDVREMYGRSEARLEEEGGTEAAQLARTHHRDAVRQQVGLVHVVLEI